MIAQASTLNLYVHQMAGFLIDKTREVYKIPAGFEPVAAIAIGYLGDPSILPDEMAKGETAPRVRKALEEIAFSGTWENPMKKHRLGASK